MNNKQSFITEIVTKGEAIVKIAHYSGKATGFTQSIDLIVTKKELITEKYNKEYNELREVINLLWAKHNVAEKLELEAYEKLDEILHAKKKRIISWRPNRR